MWILVLVASCFFGVFGQSGTVELTIEDGTIRGTINRTIGQNKTFYAFRGIPYAKPPLEDLRFKAPERNANWSDVLDCTKDRSQCVQQADSAGSEDCLYVNVYTRNLTGNLPVMVWVHGGVFYQGNSSYERFGPDYLLDENIVFVSFNYRLGILGFLSTEDMVSPGNWGIKDQVFSLEWIKRNVAYFGGNPENVTIFGESAGAVSVSLLLQTNKTEGLFQRAIMQSGTTLNLWSLSRKSRSAAFEVGKLLGIITSNSTKLVSKLRKVSVKKLYEKAGTVFPLLFAADPTEGLIFAPVVEPEHGGAVLSNKSYQLLSSGNFNHVPTIIGHTSNEAAAAGGLDVLLRTYLAVKFNTEWSDIAPYDLTNNRLIRNLASFLVRTHFFGFTPLSLSSDESIVKYISSDQFNRPIREAVLQQSRYTPVWMYVFSYEGKLGLEEERTISGVGHDEDTSYFFRENNRNYSETSSSDMLTRYRLIRLWTNFAKYGNPTPFEENLLQNVTWPIAGSNRTNLVYLNISSTLEVGVNPFADTMSFYDRLYKIHGKRSFHDTY